jgi:hypothetical protein
MRVESKTALLESHDPQPTNEKNLNPPDALALPHDTD